tara:strand:+ start:14755 stop:15015 length:261 start_codon:yes stop_codon:yes gene_type:complete
MDLLIGSLAIIVVIAVILSPFIKRGLTADTILERNVIESDIEYANLMDLKTVLELDYALGNMSKEDYKIQLTEYEERIQASFIGSN